MSEFVSGLKSLGFDITVLTALPNYPSGEIFDEYKGKKESWDEQGKILRTFIKPSKKKSSLRRLYTYMTFFYSARAGDKRHFKKKSFDIVIASSPPLFAALAGVDIATRHEAKFIFDIRDLWPDIAVSMGMMKKASVPWLWLDSIHFRILKNSDRIIVTTETDKSLIKSKGYPENRIDFIPNGASLKTFYKLPDNQVKLEKRKLGIEGKFTLCYSGSLNQGMNDVKSFVPIMEKLRNEKDIVLLLVGDGENRNEIKSDAQAGNLENIRFIPTQDLESLNRILNASDLAIIPRKHMLKGGSGGYPVKMFENWAVENPVVLCADDHTEERQLLENIKGGIAIDPGDFQSVADAVLRFMHDDKLRVECGVNGRRKVEESFSRESSTRKLSEILFTLMK
jgi:glycosyltransferase involved in cell wall biosynthesis